MALIFRYSSSKSLSLCTTLDTRIRCVHEQEGKRDREQNKIACERRQGSIVVLAGNGILKAFAGHSDICLAHIFGEILGFARSFLTM
jgi:hypothetical protein